LIELNAPLDALLKSDLTSALHRFLGAFGRNFVQFYLSAAYLAMPHVIFGTNALSEAGARMRYLSPRRASRRVGRLRHARRESFSSRLGAKLQAWLRSLRIPAVAAINPP